MSRPRVIRATLRQHRSALVTLGACSVLTLLWGVLFAVVEGYPVTTGLYWSVITAATVGYGDVIPHNPDGRLIAVFAAITAIPLYSASVGLFISGLAGKVMHEVKEEIKVHFEKRLAEHSTVMKTHFEDRLRHHLGKPS